MVGFLGEKHWWGHGSHKLQKEEVVGLQTYPLEWLNNRHTGHGVGLFQLSQVGLCRPRPGPEHSGSVCPPATLPVCPEPDLFPAGLNAAKASHAPPCLALFWHIVTWGGDGGGGDGGERAGAQLPTLPRPHKTPFSSCRCSPNLLPTNPPDHGPHPPVAPVWCVVTTCLCLIHDWELE